ncbi:MAG: hypothetical protein RSA29_17120 [Clostridium sp.]|uniref:hypothetical protein n=1 Tax=Clostridium sp. TaxID=1506 RepID=UPI003024E9C5
MGFIKIILESDFINTLAGVILGGLITLAVNTKNNKNTIKMQYKLQFLNEINDIFNNIIKETEFLDRKIMRYINYEDNDFDTQLVKTWIMKIKSLLEENTHIIAINKVILEDYKDIKDIENLEKQYNFLNIEAYVNEDNKEGDLENQVQLVLDKLLVNIRSKQKNINEEILKKIK